MNERKRERKNERKKRRNEGRKKENRALGNADYSLIAIAPRSTLVLNGST